MTQNVTGFGSVVTLFANPTFPAGLVITQFADDADSFDMASIAIAEVAMGVNGDLIKWSKANPLPVTISVIPGSDDDIALGVLAEANRVGQGKTGANDEVTLTVTYPNGTPPIIFSQGCITEAPFGNSLASSGRLKTKTYAFRFQNKVGG